jgi:hypothetical protein
MKRSRSGRLGIVGGIDCHARTIGRALAPPVVNENGYAEPLVDASATSNSFLSCTPMSCTREHHSARSMRGPASGRMVSMAFHGFDPYTVTTNPRAGQPSIVRSDFRMMPAISSALRSCLLLATVGGAGRRSGSGGAAGSGGGEFGLPGSAAAGRAVSETSGDGFPDWLSVAMLFGMAANFWANSTRVRLISSPTDILRSRKMKMF